MQRCVLWFITRCVWNKKGKSKQNPRVQHATLYIMWTALNPSTHTASFQLNPGVSWLLFLHWYQFMFLVTQNRISNHTHISSHKTNRGLAHPAVYSGPTRSVWSPWGFSQSTPPQSHWTHTPWARPSAPQTGCPLSGSSAWIHLHSPRATVEVKIHASIRQQEQYDAWFNVTSVRHALTTFKQQRTGFYLHQSDSSHEEDQRDPLVEAQPFPQHGDGEQRRGENLQLVRDLRGANSSTVTESKAAVASVTSHWSLSKPWKIVR